MKVFLDTNVLAAAAATRGLCADVLREVLVYHKLFISEQVLNELRRVLRSKFGISQDLVDDFTHLLWQDAILAQPTQVPKAELRDKDDLSILGAAISAGADAFVTGDKELQDLGHVANVEILSPRQFWERVKSQRRRGRRGKRRQSQ